MRGPFTLAVLGLGSRTGYAIWAGSMALCACGARDLGPEVTSVEPTAAMVSQLPVPVTIRGAHFLGARVSVDDRTPVGVLQAEASIGGQPLTSVMVVAPDTLTGFVPASLPVGVHDVEVRVGNRQRGTLEHGFEVKNDGVVPPVEPPVNGCNSGEFGVPQLVWPASTSDERGPALSADRLTIVFSRASEAGEDIYYATRPSVEAPFGPPMPLDGLSGDDNTTPVLSADELTIYFASNRTGNWEIWSGQRTAKGLTFGTVRQMIELSSEGNELRPWLSADQLTIYFESDRMGTASDVWKATRADLASDFSAPQQVTWLNSAANEGSPSTTPNQLTCLYVADSETTLGWKTLLRTSRASVADSFDWGTAIPGLSGHNVDGYAALSSDGRELVFGAAGVTQQIWRVAVDCAD